MPVKAALISLGCPKNQVDSERMLAVLRDAGVKYVKDLRFADVAIVNTCGFIESAVSESLSEIFALVPLKTEGRLKKIIVTGCLPERYKDEFKKEVPEADFVFGAGSYHRIAEAVLSAGSEKDLDFFDNVCSSPLGGDRVLLSPKYSAYLKIAEGCDNRCAYCVIPSIRGGYRSRAQEELISEAHKLSKMGVKELIVVAQDVTRYGTDLYRERKLISLLSDFCAVDGIKWVRLHYLYPDEIDDNLIDFIAQNDKIVKYFDIPIQHVNDRILSKMNRRGNKALIESLFAKIRAKIPGAVIRTSVIVGFPGETDAEFTELCDFLRKERFPRAGVFSYSREEGSAAFTMEGQIDEETKARRKEIAGDIQYSVMEEYMKSLLGRTLEVLTEGFDNESGLYFGRTYADSPEIDGRILFSSDYPLSPGSFINVCVSGTIDYDLTGKACAKKGEP